MDLISKETFIALCALYFFSNYKPKYSLFFCLMTIYQYSENFINYTNSIIYPEYFDFSKFKNELDEYNKNIEENNDFSKVLPKYEDKYLEQIRNLDKEFKFDAGEWYWCPKHQNTNRQFECHTSITSEQVFNEIKKWIKN